MWERNFKLHRKLAFEIYNNAEICTVCYSLEKICVHHKDENPWNNEENNLKIMCLMCHNTHHHKWKHVSKKVRKKMSLSKIGKPSNSLWHKHTKEAKIKIGLSGKWRIPWNKWISWKIKNWKKIDWMWWVEWCKKTWKSPYHFYKNFNF